MRVESLKMVYEIEHFIRRVHSHNWSFCLGLEYENFKLAEQAHPLEGIPLNVCFEDCE